MKIHQLIIILGVLLLASACSDEAGQDNNTDPQPEASPDPQPEASPDPQPEATPDPQPEATPDPEPEMVPELEQVSIPFLGTVNGAPLRCGEVYENIGTANSSIEAKDVRLYIHGVHLIDEQGEEVPVLVDEDNVFQLRYTQDNGDVGGLVLLDFTDTSSENCAFQFGTEETHSFVSGLAPPGDYVGVSFIVGVPEELNHLDGPSSAAPLNANGMQWTWASGYRHLKVDVTTTTDDRTKATYFFHPGAQGCESDNGEISGNYTCAMTLTSKIDVDLVLGSQAIEFDLGRLYAEDNLSEGLGCMGAGNIPDRQDGMEVTPGGCVEMYAALGIALPTPGEMVGTTTQTAFRSIDFEGDVQNSDPFPALSELSDDSPFGWPHPDFERDEALNVERFSAAGGTESHPPGDARYGSSCLKCHQAQGPGQGLFVMGGTMYDTDGSQWTEGGQVHFGTGVGNRFARNVEDKITDFEVNYVAEIDANGQWYATQTPDLKYDAENYMIKIFNTEGVLQRAMAIAPAGSCNHCHNGSFSITNPGE